MVDFNSIEKRWQRKWEDAGIFHVKEDPQKKKFYVLEMYPYPSGSGLHMGHARNYTIGDVFARFKRMNGFNVLYPMGYDSFGLPAENAAIKAKSHPKIFTEEAIKSFVRQQHELGLSYDWSRAITSHSPEYYRWDQWIFLKLMEKGLIYKKKAEVNWCPGCNTVLANEQVHNGKCWRHTSTDVELKHLEQWFIKITDYAEELLTGIESLKGWAEDVKTMQKNWIGRSEGVEIDFTLEGTKEQLTTYTTRPDTIYSVTFIVIAPEHPLVMEMVRGTPHEAEAKKVVEAIKKQTEIERTTPEGKDKLGCFLGRYAINPVNDEKVPIYVANFVMMYGTGIVMADAHDQRDFEFARKYRIPLKFVISKDGKPADAPTAQQAYIEDGILFNSGKFSGMHNRETLPKIAGWIEKSGWGRKTVNYRLRDWLISRQRFWGCPIPIIYCGTCGVVPVPEKDLPVRLPENYTFTVTEGNPLEHCKDFVETKCPACKGKAKRETDTMDTFVDSSWYFLRYCDPNNAKEIFSRKKANYWMPVDLYIGGKEHATMHLIYFRFFTKFLRDLGLLAIDEPCYNLYNQGMLHKGGVVMSKSKGNVVSQEEISAKYGIDTARFFLMFLASPDKDVEWDDNGVEGSFRFLNKVYALGTEKKLTGKVIAKQESRVHGAIKEVTEQIEGMKYNLALIKIMDTAHYLHKQDEINKKVLEGLLLLLAPFTPHLCEELWEKLGNKGFISGASWPTYDEKKIDLKAEAEEEFVRRTLSDIISVLGLINVDKPKKIILIAAPKWKYLFMELFKKEAEKTRDVRALISVLLDEKDLKKYGQDIAKLVPALLKDAGKVPKVVLGQDAEFTVLEENKGLMEKQFGCPVTVERAEGSKEKKAMSGMPGKAAIAVW
ncbi:leucine--tRNA ligase [Candidatus Woesearchaeota archaeon]|nr:leucine--tRNA ligase [Candidatus Woesearchaeota archaeon]